MTADDKYSLVNSDNIMQSIQMQLSRKQKIFSDVLYALIESRLNFEHFAKKDDPRSLCLSETADCERRSQTNV